MTDISGIKNELSIKLPKLQFGKGGKEGQGGDGGSIMIFAETITGDGQFLADGGNGIFGGKGGNIHIEAKNNKFQGKISAKGGDSYGKKRPKR